VVEELTTVGPGIEIKETAVITTVAVVSVVNGADTVSVVSVKKGIIEVSVWSTV
jgi:hypothetical protein